MKRVSALILGAVLALAAFSTQAAPPKRLTMGSGGTAGVYYPLGGAISQVLTTKSNGTLSVSAQATGASGENMRLLESNDVDLAILQNDVAHAGVNGLEPFKKKLVNVRAVARLYPEYLHVIATKASGVGAMKDFKGKKVSVGARGSGNEINCRQMFEFYGLNYRNLTPIFLPYGETADQFKDRSLDGFIFTIGTPNPAIQDITTVQEVTFIPLDGAPRDAIVAKFPFLVKTVIPANTYKGQTQPVETLSVQAILAVNKDLPEDTVYTIAKTLFDHLDDVARAHNKGSKISLEKAVEGITIPFHPGAARYLQEKGVSVP